MTDVFISYSRKNSEFARRLTDKLRQSGKDSWVDWEGIPLSSPNWWGEIQTGIDKADNFVFIMSPDSMSSVVCNMELDYALDFHKRVIVVVHEDVSRTESFASIAEFIPDSAMEERLEGDTPIEKARDNWTRISHINWLFFREQDDFEDSYQKLLDTVATDLGYVKAHTRYLDRAREWISSNKREDLLLFGDEIALAESWLKRGEKYVEKAFNREGDEKIDVVNPLPDDLHRQYIQVSREAEEERQRRLRELEESRKKSESAAQVADTARQRAQRIGMVAGVIGVLAIIAGIFAGFQAVNANNQAQSAAVTAEQAETDAALAFDNQQTAIVAEGLANEQSTTAYLLQATLEQQADEASNQAIAAAGTAEGAETSAAIALVAQETASAAELLANEQSTVASNSALVAAGTAEGAETSAAIALVAQETALAAEVLANAQITEAVAQQATLEQEANQAATDVADANLLLQAVTPTLNAVATNVRAAENFASASQLSARADSTFTRGNSQPLGLALAVEASYIDTPSIVRRTLHNLAYLPNARQQYTGHDDWVHDVAISPDGTLAISGGDDSRAILWDVESGEIVREFIEHDDSIRSVAFSPDGTLVATASLDETIILWDVESGQIVHRLEEHSGAVNSVEFSSDGSQLISASDDTTLLLWDVANAKVEQQFQYDSILWDAAFNPDASLIISGSDDGFLTFWDASTGELIADRREARAHVLSVAFSPDGQQVVTASSNHSITLWSVSETESLETMSRHSGIVEDVTFSPDGRYIASASHDQTVILWDVDSRQIVNQYRGHGDWIRSVAFTPDGTGIISASDDRELYFWDISRGDILLDVENRSQWRSSVSADGQLVASILPDGRITITDIRTGTPLRIFSSEFRDDLRNVDGDFSTLIFGLDMTADGRLLLSGSENGTVILWEVDNGKALHVLNADAFETHHVAISPDEQYLLAGSFSGTISLWDAESGTLENRWNPGLDGITSVAFSPDSRQIAIGGHNSDIALWDIASMDVVNTFDEHNLAVINLEFSADGSQLLSSGADSLVYLWDVATGEIIQRYAGHNGEVRALDFSPDESEVVAGSNALILRWDTETGEVIQSIPAHQAVIWDVHYLPEGNALLSSGEDLHLRVWRMDSLAQIQQWVEDNRYLPDLDCNQRLAQGTILCEDNQAPVLPTIMPTGTPFSVAQYDALATPVSLFSEALQDAENGENEGEIDNDGVEYWLYQGQPNARIDIQVESSDFDTVLTILDEIGIYLDANDDLLEGQPDAGLLGYRLPSDGEIIIRVEGFDTFESGDYTLIIDDSVAVPPPVSDDGDDAGIQDLTEAQIGANEGEIDFGDDEIWVYRGEPGEDVTISLESDDFDAHLFVYSTEEELLGEDDDGLSGSDSQIEDLSLTGNAIIVIEVRSYNDQGGGDYTLTIESDG